MSLFRRFESAVCRPSKKLSAAGRAVGQAPQPFPGPLAAHACTAALPAKAGACHSLGVSKAPFARPQKPLGSRQGRWPGSQPFPGPLAAHACTAALPAKAGACHSSGVSKAPFARLQKPLGSRQGRWPGSTALPGPLAAHACTAALPAKVGARHSLGVSKAPFTSLQKPLGSRQGTFGCTCLHRSLACQSRCMSLFRRFESAVCPPSKASRQPARPGQAPQPFPGPLAAHACTAALPAKAGACHSLGVSKAPFARLQKPLGSRQGRWPGSTALPGTFGCTCLHRSLACQSRCMSLFRRFESAVCPPSKASRQPAGPLARLHSPSRDLWLHMPAPQPCLPKPVHVTL